MPNESIQKIAQVAIGVCMVCSLLVSTASVALRPLQEENKRLDRIRNILKAGGILSVEKDVRTVYREKVKPLLIELSTGKEVSTEAVGGISVEDFDAPSLARKAEYGRSLSREKDIAGLERIPKYMVVYLVKERGELKTAVLPIYGKGLWSTIYGFIALEGDLRTVRGITFYEHGETPGLGGEIENPNWQKKWVGKEAYDEEGRLVLEVIKGRVVLSRPEAKHQVDGISGATLTTRGVNNLVRFWLGPEGYGPFLRKLKESTK